MSQSHPRGRVISGGGLAAGTVGLVLGSFRLMVGEKVIGALLLIAAFLIGQQALEFVRELLKRLRWGG